MKVAIIGSCLSGMSLGLRLLNSGHEVILLSPHQDLNDAGAAYLINSVTLNSLRSLNLQIDSAVTPLEGDSANDYFGESATNAMGLLYSVHRADLHKELYRSIGADRFLLNKRFCHFEPPHNVHVESAVFHDGTEVIADLFVGADGAQSVVREKHVQGSELRNINLIQVSGISRVTKNSTLLNKLIRVFVDPENGTQILIYPTTKTLCSWILQFEDKSYSLSNQKLPIPKLVDKFCERLPVELKTLFAEGRFVSSRLNHCSDRKLPEFIHKDNVILIGEAAHPTLPSLTKGTDSDLEDALLLGDLIDGLDRGFFPTMDTCLTTFTRERRPLLNSRFRRGRKNHALRQTRENAFSY